MTLDDYNAYCASLHAATHVVQWGGAHVWKVGGKVFAIGGWDDGEGLFVTFKCSDMSFDLLKEQPGCRPAPYLASRGMSWIQRTSDESMDDAALKDYLAESHRLVAAKLARRVKLEIGLPGS
jgi:predicted DNA-binding protein (MmcQ/YjbR family)